MTFLYEKSFEYHQSITKKDKKEEIGRNPVSTVFYTVARPVVSRDWWRRGGSNPLPQRCQRCALPDELRPHVQ